MPCSDSGPSREEIEHDYQMRQVATRLACDRCRELLKREGCVPVWAAAWWAEHQAQDAKRLERDRQAQREAKIRERALSKLTQEERDELGV
jgi:hypothetical protein